MSMTALVTTYGYFAVFAGTLLEGEAILIAAGVAAQQGLLDLPLAIGVATLGAVLGDQSCFLLGRWRGRELLARLPALAANGARIRALSNGHSTMAIFAIRFLYGLRVAGCVLMGAAGMGVEKFAPLNLLSAAVWATVIAGAGYSISSTIEALTANVRRFEAILLAAACLAAALYWLWRRASARCARTTGATSPRPR